MVGMGCGASADHRGGASAASEPPVAPPPAHVEDAGAKLASSDFQPAAVFDAPAKDSKPPAKTGFRLVWVPDGSGQWKYVSPAGDGSVLIASAKGLMNGDRFTGTSDPYCLGKPCWDCNPGPAGSRLARYSRLRAPCRDSAARAGGVLMERQKGRAVRNAPLGRRPRDDRPRVAVRLPPAAAAAAPAELGAALPGLRQ